MKSLVKPLFAHIENSGTMRISESSLCKSTKTLLMLPYLHVSLACLKLPVMDGP